MIARQVRVLAVGTLSGAALLPATAMAESVVTPMVGEALRNASWSGFLSARAGRINSGEYLYQGLYEDRWSFSDESVFGLQLDTAITDPVSVSVQLTTKGSDRSVEMEWAYLEYELAHDVSLRFGRLRAPGFMLTEFVDVGYAYPWVQVPFEVYGWLPFQAYEGVDLGYRVGVGDAEVRINPYMGTIRDQVTYMGGKSYGRQDAEFAGLELQAELESFSVRIGHSSYRLDIISSQWDTYINQIVSGVQYVPDLSPFIEPVALPGMLGFVEEIMIDGILQQAIDNPAIAQFLGITATTEQLQGEQASLRSQLPVFQQIPMMNGRTDGSFSGVGLSYDDGRYMLMTEITSAEIGGIYPDVDSGYLTLGYRMGAWLPHLTFSKMYVTDENERPRLSALQFDEAIWNSSAQLVMVADGAKAYSNVLTVMNTLIKFEQETWTLGLRWDPVPGIAVKTDVFEARPGKGSYGFAFPADLVDSFVSQEASVGNLEISDPAKRLYGMRMSIDAVF